MSKMVDSHLTARLLGKLLPAGGDGRESEEAAALLAAMEYEAVAPIRAILQGGDALWKAAVLEQVVAKLPKDIGMEFAPDLLSLVMNASEPEIEAGVDELAEEILSGWF